MKIKRRLFLGLIISCIMMTIISSCEKEIIDKSSCNSSNTTLIHKWSLEAWIDYHDSLVISNKHKKQYHITGWTAYQPDYLNYIVEARLCLSSTFCENNNNGANCEPNKSSIIQIKRKSNTEITHTICIDDFDFQIDGINMNSEDEKSEVLHSFINYMDRTYLN
ncbi:MAG: hypothetical protein GX612_05230 [Bacteroidales bacterium]|nr:hypothetical protein [Bacteroidales bacterium]